MVLSIDDVKEQFRYKLLAAVKAAGLPVHGSGAWLGRAMGVSVKAAQKWLIGESMPHPAKWPELAAILGQPCDYFSPEQSPGEPLSVTSPPISLHKTIEESDLLDKFRKLSRGGQLAVLSVLQKEYELIK